MTSSQTLIAGRYRVQEQLGQGGMGRVWLGSDEKLNRTVALKQIQPLGGLAPDGVEELRTRALREARAAARLDHPGVVRVYDIVVEHGVPWIVMQYVPSRSLATVVAEDGPLTPQQTAQVGLAVLTALTAAHRVGILHRDVKPGNVLIADDGTVVLTDFGLATIAGDPAITHSGVLIGSPSFMAPERAANGSSGPAADLWSLGATLYFAVEGRPPYEGSSVLATLSALATEDPAPAIHSGPLRPVLDGLLRRDPNRRLPAAGVERLLRAAVSAPVGPRPTLVLPATRATAPVGAPLPRPVPERSAGARTPARTVAVLAALVTLAGLVVWALADDRPQGTDQVAPTMVPTSEPPTTTSEPPPAPTSEPPTAPTSEPPPASQLPPGWHLYQDGTGFTVGVPESWVVSKRGSIVYFSEPGGARLLGIDQTDEPRPDPVADWLAQEAYRVARGDFPGYQRVRLEPVDYFESAADWEFTYVNGGTRVHVNNRGFITSPRQAYGMWWSTPDSQWAESLADLAVIQRTFRPTP